MFKKHSFTHFVSSDNFKRYTKQDVGKRMNHASKNCDTIQSLHGQDFLQDLGTRGREI